MIGAGARVGHAYVGPYTAISEDVVIRRAEVEQRLAAREGAPCSG